MKKRPLIILLSLVLILIILGIAIWYFFYYTPVCKDQTCFKEYQDDCSRASYVNQGQMILQYKILGKENNNCNINVKFIEGNIENQDSTKLQNKEMICGIPLGAQMTPESDISLCHGLLKEELQDLIIQKLHTYVVQNMGKINLELLKINNQTSY